MGSLGVTVSWGLGVYSRAQLPPKTPLWYGFRARSIHALQCKSSKPSGWCF